MASMAANVLSDTEWRALLQHVLKIGRAQTHESLRMTTLKALRDFIPFESAVFFLADPKTCDIIDCVIAQPLGANISSGEYEAFMRTQWQSCDGEEGKPFESRVYLCTAHPVDDKDYGVLAESHMLACDLANAEGPLASLALTRTALQGRFTTRDEFVVNALKPCLTECFATMYAEGRYTALKGKTLREECGLTTREIQVTECVVYGMTTPEIATKLGISVNTAKKHLENIYRKAGVNNRMSLMKFAQHYLAAK